jgi:hypothetical protein
VPKSFIQFDTISDDLVQRNGLWIMICRLSSIDIEMKSDFEKEAIMLVFRQIINSFNSHVQIIQRKKEVDFSQHVASIKVNAIKSHPNVKAYADSYIEYLQEVSKDKLEINNYIAIKTDRRYKYDEAKSLFLGVKNQLRRALDSIGITFEQLEGIELKQVLAIPDFIKECPDYAVYGNKYIRTYIIQDYPRESFPNWLKPLLNFPHPIEITQHIQPYPRDKVIHSLEVTIAKMESTLNMQARNGFVISKEIEIRLEDAKDLLERLASGKDNIVQTYFYITLFANHLEQLVHHSHELESVFRQLQIKFRKNFKDVDRAIKSIIPVCDNHFPNEAYTFDTKSLATLIPFTTKDFCNGGIFYGISEDTEELITFDRFSMPNPNAVILGAPGYGKSMLTKIEASRQIINGAQGIIIDHNGEYRDFCSILGGQYVNEGDRPNWNSHLLVFGGEELFALRTIWNHILKSPLSKRLLVIDEFHNILKADKELMLTVMREIRKYYVAPTLVTQNITEFLQSPEGQMIIDLCSIKILMHQGENDLAVAEKLFELSKYEKMFLKTCNIGHGYLYTNQFKTKVKFSLSEKERMSLTTNPKERVLDA